MARPTPCEVVEISALLRPSDEGSFVALIAGSALTSSPPPMLVLYAAVDLSAMSKMCVVCHCFRPRPPPAVQTVLTAVVTMLGHPEPTWGEVRRVSKLFHPLSFQQCTLVNVVLAELPRGRPGVSPCCRHSHSSLFMVEVGCFTRSSPRPLQLLQLVQLVELRFLVPSPWDTACIPYDLT